MKKQNIPEEICALISEEEINFVKGLNIKGNMETVRISPIGSTSYNPAFDVTPGRLITGLITERGICDASADGLAELFPERLVSEVKLP